MTSLVRRGMETNGDKLTIYYAYFSTSTRCVSSRVVDGRVFYIMKTTKMWYAYNTGIWVYYYIIIKAYIIRDYRLS